MEETCRVCMGTSGAFTNIFDERYEWNTCIAEMIAECTGFVVRRGDLLPETVCPSCLEDAVSAFNLKRTCEQSHTLHFSRMEEDEEVDICDEHDDEHWEAQPSEVISDKDKFICAHCPKSYMHRQSLHTHTRTHTGERPYKCSHCSKSFLAKHQLERHIRTHTGDRPYECSNCSKSFITKYELERHIPVHTKNLPHQCSNCSKSFVTKSQLKRHIPTHTDDRPYKCSHCSKSFLAKQKLERHILTHTGERLYKCTHCSETFARNDTLNQHKINKHTQNDN